MISRQDYGRTNQKIRTGRAIIDAAAEIVREGRTPTVADAAERALVSRATAYRYFPSQHSLLLEVRADASQPSIDALLAEAGDDLTARVDVIARTIVRVVFADEALYRNQIRAAMDTWFGRDDDSTVPVREGRRRVWIDKALAPVAAHVPASTLARLRAGLTTVIAVDAVVALIDVAGLDAKKSEDVLAWTAVAMARQALDEAGR